MIIQPYKECQWRYSYYSRLDFIYDKFTFQKVIIQYFIINS